jgi:DNA-binding CsgD family transcriptional regulator
MERSVESVATAFTALRRLGITRRETYSGLLHDALVARPELLGLWSVWEPDSFDGRDRKFRFAPGHDATGRFVPYWHRGYGSPKLDPVTGYEHPGVGDWYWVPKRSNERCRAADYPYLVAGRMMRISSEIVPICESGRVVGVVGADQVVSPRAARRGAAKPVVEFLDASPDSERLRLLTNREREVHHWLTEGKSNDEIAGILGISAHTVKNHLYLIFQKLDVENRYAAALAGRAN